jgi:hypothetical protein
MSVSKRVRYEVLRRDGYRCRYCGTTADAVQLRVDHVVPVALGGSDDPSNLVAACDDCNSGKTSTSPDEPLVAQVSDDAIRWAAAIREAAAGIRAEGVAAELDQAWFRQQFRRHMPDAEMHPGWKNTLGSWLSAGLSRDDILEMIWAAERSKANDKWRYLCGCCWTRLRQIQDRARELLAGDASDPFAGAAVPRSNRKPDDYQCGMLDAVSLVDAFLGLEEPDGIYERINAGIAETGIDVQGASFDALLSAARQAGRLVGAQ